MILHYVQVMLWRIIDHLYFKPIGTNSYYRLPAIVGSEPRQTLLFELVSEYVFPVARVDSRTQESQRGRNGLSWFRPIDALCPAVDDPYTQEHLKSGGYNRVYRR
jgi:hypothetical protein